MAVISNFLTMWMASAMSHDGTLRVPFFWGRGNRPPDMLTGVQGWHADATFFGPQTALIEREINTPSLVASALPIVTLLFGITPPIYANTESRRACDEVARGHWCRGPAA